MELDINFVLMVLAGLGICATPLWARAKYALAEMTELAQDGAGFLALVDDAFRDDHVTDEEFDQIMASGRNLIDKLRAKFGY